MGQRRGPKHKPRRDNASPSPAPAPAPGNASATPTPELSSRPTEEGPEATSAPGRTRRPRGFGALGYAGFLVLALWMWMWEPWRSGLRPTRLALDAVLAAQPLVWLMALWVGVRSFRDWRRLRRLSVNADLPQRRALRVIAGSLGVVSALCLLQLGAWGYLAWRHRLPALPDPADLRTPSRDRIAVLLIGESTAQGEPYGGTAESVGKKFTPWLSIAQIMGWRMQQLLPGKEVQVDLLAEGGFALENVHKSLINLKRRPHVVAVYSGHNEFQAKFPWDRTVAPWSSSQSFNDVPGLYRAWAARWGPAGRLIQEAVDQSALSQAPAIAIATADTQTADGSEPDPSRATRGVIDGPVCTEAEYQALLVDFERRLDAIAAYAVRLGALPVLIIPSGNDADFDPNRSVFSRPVTQAQRRHFLSRLYEARTLLLDNPRDANAADILRDLIAEQPGFAEAHYLLGQALRSAGDNDNAKIQFRIARDNDGLPLRCPTPFQDVYRRIAKKYDCLLIDSAEVFEKISPAGLLDASVFHDAQHPNFLGYAALGEAMLQGIQSRGMLGLDKEASPLRIDPALAAAAFGITRARWAIVCRWTERFYDKVANARYDPTDRLRWRTRYARAAEQLEGPDPNVTPESVGIPALGIPQRRDNNAAAPP